MTAEAAARAAEGEIERGAGIGNRKFEWGNGLEDFGDTAIGLGDFRLPFST